MSVKVHNDSSITYMVVINYPKKLKIFFWFVFMKTKLNAVHLIKLKGKCTQLNTDILQRLKYEATKIFANS